MPHREHGVKEFWRVGVVLAILLALTSGFLIPLLQHRKSEHWLIRVAWINGDSALNGVRCALIVLPCKESALKAPAR